MTVEIERLVSVDAEHCLECRHCIGRNCKTYYMKCIPLKDMPDGRKKVLVFGNLYWGGEEKKIRYVDSSRVHDLKH